MGSPLFNYLFFYLVLGAIFAVGVLYGVAQGDLGLARGRKRNNLVMLLSGLVLYLALHGFFQFVAVRF